MPSLLAYAETVGPGVVDRFLDTGGDAALPGCALDFCSVLGQSLSALVKQEHRAVFAEALRFTMVALLDICDGHRTMAEVVDAVAVMRGDGPDDRGLLMDTLRRLHALGVIVFGRIDPVWGWRKGARSDLAAIPPLRPLRERF